MTCDPYVYFVYGACGFATMAFLAILIVMALGLYKPSEES
jgi:hypothetical protein